MLQKKYASLPFMQRLTCNLTFETSKRKPFSLLDNAVKTSLFCLLWYYIFQNSTKDIEITWVKGQIKLMILFQTNKTNRRSCKDYSQNKWSQGRKMTTFPHETCLHELCLKCCLLNNCQDPQHVDCMQKWRPSCKKGVYQFLADFHFLQDRANFWQTDLFWYGEKHHSVIVLVDLCFVLQK